MMDKCSAEIATQKAMAVVCCWTPLDSSICRLLERSMQVSIMLQASMTIAQIAAQLAQT